MSMFEWMNDLLCCGGRNNEPKNAPVSQMMAPQQVERTTSNGTFQPMAVPQPTRLSNAKLTDKDIAKLLHKPAKEGAKGKNGTKLGRKRLGDNDRHVDSSQNKSTGEGRWSAEEDKLLLDTVEHHGPKNWKEIAKVLVGRTGAQCCQRWKRLLPHKVRQKFTSEEDELIKKLHNKYGDNWTTIASQLEGRTGKQVRDRYLNYLKLNPKSSKFNEEEDKELLRLYMEIGPKWKEIANKMEGRSENMVKNRFYSYIKKKMLTENLAPGESAALLRITQENADKAPPAPMQEEYKRPDILKKVGSIEMPVIEEKKSFTSQSSVGHFLKDPDSFRSGNGVGFDLANPRFQFEEDDNFWKSYIPALGEKRSIGNSNEPRMVGPWGSGNKFGSDRDIMENMTFSGKKENGMHPPSKYALTPQHLQELEKKLADMLETVRLEIQGLRISTGTAAGNNGNEAIAT